jgi:hypothetical protein
MAVLDSNSGGARLLGAYPLGIENFPFTMAVWIKRTGTTGNNNGIIGIGNTTDRWGNGHRLITGDGSNLNKATTYQVCNGSGGSSVALPYTNVTTIPTADWEPWVVEFASASSRTMYQGSNAAITNTTNIGCFTGTGSNGINQSTGVFHLGEDPIGSTWKGLIAHAAVWDKVLTESERNAFLGGDNPLTIADDDLLGYWAEDFFQDTDWYYEDKSGNGNHLLLRSGAVMDTDTAGPDVDAPSDDDEGLAFTVAPTITTRTTTSYTLVGTTNADCDVYAVATLTTATDPDGPQIFAGTDGDDTVAQAAADVAATGGTPFTLTLSDLTESAHNIHVVPRRDTVE